MNRKAESYTRLSLSIVLFVVASLMPNVWTTLTVSFVALYALVTGLIRLKSNR